MTRGEQIIHNVRGQLNTVTMNAELGRMLYLQEGKPSERLVGTLEKIVQHCATCATELDSLYEYIADLERK